MLVRTKRAHRTAVRRDLYPRAGESIRFRFSHATKLPCASTIWKRPRSCRFHGALVCGVVKLALSLTATIDLKDLAWAYDLHLSFDINTTFIFRRLGKVVKLTLTSAHSALGNPCCNMKNQPWRLEKNKLRIRVYFQLITLFAISNQSSSYPIP